MADTECHIKCLPLLLPGTFCRILASNTHVKCDILNCHPLCTFIWKIESRALSRNFFFFFSKSTAQVIIFHPITQFSTAECTQQLTWSNSYTNVSNFSAPSVTNSTPEGCCCRNDGTRAGIDGGMLGTNNPPPLPPRGEQASSSMHTDYPTVWCSDIRGNLIRSSLTCT